MLGKITSIQQKTSHKDGSILYLVTFKMLDGSSKISWVGKEYRNYKNWEPVIKSGVDTLVGNLEYKGDLIDADSPVKIISGDK